MGYLVPVERTSKGKGYIQSHADIERWWIANQDKFWNKETGMYSVGSVCEAVDSFVEPTNELLEQIEADVQKSIDKPVVSV